MREGEIMKALRISALLLAGVLSISPLCAYAQDLAVEDYGITDEQNILLTEDAESLIAEGDYGRMHWTLSLNGVLTVSGTASAESVGRAPWRAYRDRVTALSVESGITGVGGFKDYSSLRQVTLSETVTTIGDSAFAGCTALRQVSGMQNVQTIGDSAFADCAALRNVALSKQLSVLGSYAFQNSGLEAVEIPASLTELGYDGRVFYRCENLRQAVIGDGDGSFSVPAECFRGCAALEQVTIGDAVTYLRENAFSDCEQLEQVSLGKRLAGIGWMSFSDCRSLKNLVIPDAARVLEYGCFSGCTSLTKVTVGVGVRSLKGNNFAGCTSLKAVYFLGDMPGFANRRIFSGTNLCAYYPVNNVSWKGMKSYGGAVAWKSWHLPLPYCKLVLKSVRQTKNGAKLSWERLYGSAGYRIYRRTGNGAWKRIGRSRTATYLDRTVRKGKTYAYRVSAYHGTEQSKVSKIVTVAVSK